MDDFLNPDIFDINNLSVTGNKFSNKYLNSKPYPHIIIDNAFREEFLEKVLLEFPDLKNLKDRLHYSDDLNEKFASPRGDHFLGEYSKSLFRFLNSSNFIDFLQSLTSMKESIIPDSHLIGGGLHEIKNGGVLKMHSDFSKHPETNLDRRINLLVYLNKNWKESYGGHFQLMDIKTREIKKKVLPIFNRIVIFGTNDFTFHGHPDPLTCPPNRSRKSLALYYFSNGRPKSEIKRNEKTKLDTIYLPRKGEDFHFKYYLKDLTKNYLPANVLKLTKKMIHYFRKK